MNLSFPGKLELLGFAGHDEVLKQAMVIEAGRVVCRWIWICYLHGLYLFSGTSVALTLSAPQLLEWRSM